MPVQFVMLLLLAMQDAPPKAAWEWTNEERIAARTDAVSRAARRDAAVAAGDVSPGEDADDIVVGSRNPELLMPYELMDRVALAFFTDGARQAQWRERWRAGEEILGDDFWERLAAVAHPFFESHRRFAELTKQAEQTTDGERRMIREEQQMIHRSQCRLRLDALEAARSVFGPDRFDHFLYEVIAPGEKILISLNEPFGPSGDPWRWLSEGCL